jgi:hypothetical protein
LVKSKFAFLVVGLAALLAFGAMSASAASASAQFHAESSPTFFKGEQETKNVLTTTGGTFKCTGADFTSGEVRGTSFETLQVHPEYTGCTGLGQQAVVNSYGCYFGMSANSAGVGALRINCETGKQITMTWLTAGCTWTIGAQTPANDLISYENQGTGAQRRIVVTFHLEGIQYTSSGGLCGASGTNGTLTGSFLLKGYNTAAFATQHSIWVE